MKTIIINQDEDKVTIALKENGKVIELYEDYINSGKQEGNIYCGIVRSIIPGMQSAFIDINESKNAFIHIKDILPKVSNQTGNKEEKFEGININDYIKVGDSILVQARKDGEGKKGARVSKHINMSGKYVVLMPDTNFVTVSQKIDDPDERKKLKNIIESILKEEIKRKKYGIIVRTAAVGVDEQFIRKDIVELINTYKSIIKKYSAKKKLGKPVKLFDGASMTRKLIIGIINNDQYKIIVNTKQKFEEVNELIQSLANKRVELKLEEEDLLSKYEIDLEIKKLQERKIWLKCGGFITIDKTEALTAIDVNSGKFVGSKNKTKEETLYRVNEEATVEIAKQLRLRNIGGIVVIDYIDMENNEYRKELLELLKKEIKNDRGKVQLVGFTKLDLLELTRKRL